MGEVVLVLHFIDSTSLVPEHQVCPDYRAFAFAHDPAQCIAEGRVFQRARLNDLWFSYWTSLEADKEERRTALALAEQQEALENDHLGAPGGAEQLQQNYLVTAKTLSTKPKRTDDMKPVEARLTRNFRSPQAILDIAQTLVEVIQKFAPDSVDSLGHEVSWDGNGLA